MTIEQHIKTAMVECQLTEQQEDKLLLGIENYLNEIEQVKNLNIPAVIKCEGDERKALLIDFFMYNNPAFEGESETVGKLIVDKYLKEKSINSL